MAVIENRTQSADAVCTVALCLAIHSNEKPVPLAPRADANQAQYHREAEFTATPSETLNVCCKCCQACHRARSREGQQTWRYRGLATKVPRSNLGARMRGFTFAWFTLCMGTGGLSLLLGAWRRFLNAIILMTVLRSTTPCRIPIHRTRHDRSHCVRHRLGNVGARRPVVCSRLTYQ